MLVTMKNILAIFCIFYNIKYTISNNCTDKSATSSCIYWKSNHQFCDLKDSINFCKMTCGFCSPVTSCGRSTVTKSRIINGVNAVHGTWPWIASLQKDKKHHCGATLLSPKWVLTAGHCVEKITGSDLFQGKYTIKLGMNDYIAHDSNTQTINIKTIKMNPNYKKQSMKADIALVELSNPAKLNHKVNIPCLPRKGIYPAIGTQCYITGWGMISYPGRFSHILQQARLPIVSSIYCKWQSEVVCVGRGRNNQTNGKQYPNACIGDSGGPLVCQKSNGKWQLEGVASFVYEYCKYYTGYSPVNKYLDWIKYIVKN